MSNDIVTMKIVHCDTFVELTLTYDNGTQVSIVLPYVFASILLEELKAMTL